MSEKLPYQNILGVRVTSASEAQILKYIITSLKLHTTKYYIVTPNSEIITYALSHSDFKNILNHAQIALPDGIGVLMAAKVLGKQIRARITGIDLMEILCKQLSKEAATVGFLGGRGQVAERVAERLAKKYPGIKVGFAGPEWPKSVLSRGPARNFLPTSAQSSEAGFSDLPARVSPSTSVTPAKLDILFVAFGFPKQEEWIAENLPKIPVKVAMSVGGSFDMISGRTSRAPEKVQSLGLEWLYRLIQEPWRWRRQLALLRFMQLVLKEKIS